MQKKAFMMVASAMLMSAVLAGCSKPANEDADNPATKTANGGHAHGEWWCDEHGVPEEVCARCTVSLVADFKAKGDWCEEHNRPDSQCFICHPEKEQEFAALYKAKYGADPPAPTDR
jgi:hypothetical protein